MTDIALTNIALTNIASKPRWDIFCKIVDNFGDIGVCWRLACQLQKEHDLQVRLWVDNLEIAQKIITIININKQSQMIDNIEVLFFNLDESFTDAADVVIETFSCGLPETYLQLMSKKQSKWVNVEYLSAERWVEDFHAKPSPQVNGLIRYFYFPGFTEKTGGLIREANIDCYSDFRRNNSGVLKTSLFCYQNAPIKDLFTALQANNHAVCMYVPESNILPKIAEYFNEDSVKVGDKLTQNNLTVEILPFLSQADYDQLLRDCDLNFVRGEDSWLRAIWAGKPFIWQPYVQDEGAHITKLNAFLDLFYANFNQKNMLCKAHGCWTAGQMPKDVFQGYLSHFSAIQTYTFQQSQQLAKQTDLATKLVNFCHAFDNT